MCMEARLVIAVGVETDESSVPPVNFRDYIGVGHEIHPLICSSVQGGSTFHRCISCPTSGIANIRKNTSANPRPDPMKIASIRTDNPVEATQISNGLMILPARVCGAS